MIYSQINRPYHYQQNSQDHENLHFNTNNSTEDDNTDQEKHNPTTKST